MFAPTADKETDLAREKYALQANNQKIIEAKDRTKFYVEVPVYSIVVAWTPSDNPDRLGKSKKPEEITDLKIANVALPKPCQLDRHLANTFRLTRGETQTKQEFT